MFRAVKQLDNKQKLYIFLPLCMLLYNGQKACYECLSTGWVRCPEEDHYEQHPGLQIRRVEGTNAGDKRQR